MKEYKPETCGESVWKDGIPYCKLSALPHDPGSRKPCDVIRNYECAIPAHERINRLIDNAVLYGGNKNGHTG